MHGKNLGLAQDTLWDGEGDYLDVIHTCPMDNIQVNKTITYMSEKSICVSTP